MESYYKHAMRKCILSMIFMTGIIFAVVTTIIWKMGLSLTVGIVVSFIIILLQFLISPIVVEWIYNIDMSKEETFLSEDILNFIKNTCDKVNIKVPKLGIIDDGNPNAFTYGYTPSSAKLALTTGLVERLDDEELKSVIAHEIGHIKHYDFIVMTLVSTIPLILYQIYIGTRSKEKSTPSYWIGIGAYIVYILSQYLVLMFSRVREYYADNFAKNIVKDGSHLKSALIKIAYGLADCDEESTEKPRASSLAFTNNIQNEAFMLTNYKAFDKENIEKSLMRWDLKSVWGKWYELNSTHPLTSKRILALNKEKIENHKTNFKDIVIFLLDCFMNILPMITAFTMMFMFTGDKLKEVEIFSSIKDLIFYYPISVAIVGGSILAKYYYSFGHGFKKSNVYDLLAREDASPIKGIPAVLEGKVIGRGIPGLFYSEDIMIDDGTGIMIVDYKQPFRFLEFIFGVFKVDEMKDKDIKIVGWYKRGVRPYFVSRYMIKDGKKIISYNYILTQLLGYLLVLYGVGCSFFDIVM
ncbi:zinc metalloprotease HtpX [Dethiothermospora halolimnae]|uniref:zinc metalloprotease HtpX n=1 Tax=Dethiothermospora halolimnae TaxID=3114390 RepID=UPI003CCB97E2